MRAQLLILPILATVIIAAPADAQTPATLPAAFYDVDVREQLGFAGSESRRTFRGGGGSYGPTRFIISADSLLYRHGPEHAEIPVSAFVRVEEFRRPAANRNAWVRIVYVIGDDERELFVRLTRTRNQEQLLATLRFAMERNAAARDADVH